jgi:hypothetical protein
MVTMQSVRRTVVLAALIAFAAPAVPPAEAAVPPPGTDLFGMYADNNFNGDPSDENPTFVHVELATVQVFIYLTGISAPSIGAYEFALAYSGPGEAPYLSDDGLPAQAINVGTYPDFIIGVATPLLPDEFGNAILMAPSYFVIDPEPAYVAVTPTSIPYIPDQITYVEYDDPTIAHAMYPASENFVDPIFAFNTGLIGTSSATWSAVKALYR